MYLSSDGSGSLDSVKDKVADLPSSPTNPSYNSPDKVQDQSTNALKSLGEKMK